MRVLIVDNRDSFTYNLCQLVGKLTAREPLVIPNTERRWRELIAGQGVAALVLSPGPGSPEQPDDFGICGEIIQDSRVPLLGVCLGHQGLGHAYGARVVRAPVPMHGRVSRVTHDGSALFAGIPRSFEAVRYHSLCLDKGTIPSCLRIAATSDDGVVMAVRHLEHPQFGVQFHPESVLARHSERLVRNFLDMASRQGHQVACTERPKSTQSRISSLGQRVVFRALDQWVDPVDAFEALYARSRNAFWMDSSAVVPGYSRFSAMGDVSDNRGAVLRYRSRDRTIENLEGGRTRFKQVPSLLAELRERLSDSVQRDESLPFDFQTGLVGYFGYELRNELGSPTERVSALPDATFFDVDRCIVFDHVDRQVFLVAREAVPGSAANRWFDRMSTALTAVVPQSPRSCSSTPTLVVRLADGPESYTRKIRFCQEQLAAGESYQICLSSEFEIPSGLSPFETYRILRKLNPAPYAAFLRFGDSAVLSSSPERFLKVARDRTISAKPIKGTAARSADPTEDARLAQWLRNDEKSRSENLMITDLLRNDIGRVADIGTVDVPKLNDLESYATVHQLVSTVTGCLHTDKDCLDCLTAAFPGGSMTGAPKLRTMSIIDRLEQRARGVYSGALGFLSHGDVMDLSIVIRTIVMEPSRVCVASGGGIVAMSNPRDEFDEMVLKARAPLRALAVAHTGEPDGYAIRYVTP